MTIVGLVQPKLTRAQTVIGTSVCVTLRQPMTTTRCGWIRMTDNLRGVEADPLLVLQAEIGATGWYIMYVMTQSVGNEVTASNGRRE